LFLNCNLKIVRANYPVVDPLHYVRLPPQDGFNGANPEPAGQDPVVTAGCSSALDMPQHGYPDIVTFQLFADVLGQLKNILPALLSLSYHDDAGGFARLATFFQGIQQVHYPGAYIRHQELLRTCTYSTVQGYISGVTAHNFNPNESVVGSGGVSDHVYCLKQSVQGSIVTNGKNGSANNVVNSTRNPDTW